MSHIPQPYSEPAPDSNASSSGSGHSQPGGYEWPDGTCRPDTVRPMYFQPPLKAPPTTQPKAANLQLHERYRRLQIYSSTAPREEWEDATSEKKTFAEDDKDARMSLVGNRGYEPQIAVGSV